MGWFIGLIILVLLFASNPIVAIIGLILFALIVKCLSIVEDKMNKWPRG